MKNRLILLRAPVFKFAGLPLLHGHGSRLFPVQLSRRNFLGRLKIFRIAQRKLIEQLLRILRRFLLRIESERLHHRRVGRDLGFLRRILLRRRLLLPLLCAGSRGFLRFRLVRSQIFRRIGHMVIARICCAGPVGLLGPVEGLLFHGEIACRDGIYVFLRLVDILFHVCFRRGIYA